MTEVISRKELIDYWMDPKNEQLVLIGGVGSGKTTLCEMFKKANPHSFVYDIDDYDNIMSAVSDFMPDAAEVVRVAQGISPVMLWIPGAEYLLLSTDSNPFLPNDYIDLVMRDVSPDHHICNYTPEFKYRTCKTMSTEEG